MSQIVQKSVIAPLVALVVNTSGAPVTGLVFGNMTCLYRKEGAGSFTSKTITALNWIEIGNGIYTVTFTASELDTLGSFTFLLNSAGNAQSVTIVTIVPVILGAVTVDQCILTGHIIDLSGSPVENASVSVKILAQPTILGNLAITSTLLSTKTDSNGQFFITLARNATVEVFIPSLNYTRDFIVPAVASADLFTDIP